MKKKLFIFALASLHISLSGCIVTFQPVTINTNPTKTTTQTTTKTTTTEKVEVASVSSKGQASYYNDKFQGAKTASGERYDKNKLTAAHKTLPFQTKVEVKNLKNNKSVIVIINDRLPTTSKREIDLSYKAAQQIDMVRDGVAQVEIKILK
ncbi:MAG: septal ring lytic transglycosylase RlpA family protein [Cytophagales bacterium]|nr:MAG: septal ring lytic transglycosylase RlpA family protein [Cytophagales bacterium]